MPNDDIRDFVLWSYYTGMRPGESRSLTWEGFDRETWTLRLHARNAKTGYGRAIALDGALRDIVARRVERRELRCPYIFQKKGKRIDYVRPWQKACAAVGLAGRRLYDLRRTAIRNMVRAGVPERVAMEISGHRTRSSFDRYNITSEDDLRKAAIRVSEFVDQLPKTSNVSALRPSALSEA